MHPAARKRESPDPAQELWVWTSGTILRPDRDLIKLMGSVLDLVGFQIVFDGFNLIFGSKPDQIVSWERLRPQEPI